MMARRLEGQLEITGSQSPARARSANLLYPYRRPWRSGEMAEVIRTALAQSKTPLSSAPPATPTAVDLDMTQLDPC